MSTETETKHTPTPWSVGNTRREYLPGPGEFTVTAIHFGPSDNKGNCIALAHGHGGLSSSDADAARIVACVNALAGISDPAGFVRRALAAGVAP